MGTSRGPVLNPISSPDEVLSEALLLDIIAAAVPVHTFRVGREWTWTRSSGIWRLNIATDQGLPSHLRVRIEQPGAPCSVSVPLTRRGVNAALRFLVLVDAIDRHPDDATAAPSDHGSST